jgi:hypothetical protein
VHWVPVAFEDGASSEQRGGIAAESCAISGGVGLGTGSRFGDRAIGFRSVEG